MSLQEIYLTAQSLRELGPNQEFPKGFSCSKPYSFLKTYSTYVDIKELLQLLSSVEAI